MKKKNIIFSLSIGVCIIFLGIICLAIPKTNKSAGEGIEFGNLTDIERDALERKWMENAVVSMLEKVDIIQKCEADISWSKGKADRADIKVTVSAGSIGNDTMKTNIEKNISKMLDVSTENVKVQIIFPRKSATALK